MYIDYSGNFDQWGRVGECVELYKKKMKEDSKDIKNGVLICEFDKGAVGFCVEETLRGFRVMQLVGAIKRGGLGGV